MSRPSKNLQILLNRSQRIQPWNPVTPKQSKNLLMLVNQLQTREWLRLVEEQLIEAIIHLRGEVKFIEHLPQCWICKANLQLDVERYNGTHSTWYLCLENNEYLEAEYPDCPKEKNYRIDSYWEQVKRFREKGSIDSDANTMEFILDRAKWAYKITGKQIKLARQMLRLVRTWEFSDENILEFDGLYEDLGMFEISYPPSFWGDLCYNK